MIVKNEVLVKKLFILIFTIPFLFINAQKIGEFAKEKPRLQFPNNSLGIDIMIGEGGFGFGGFYRYTFSVPLTGFVDFSISESKNEREIDRYDIFGRPLPIIGKKNRVFLLPLNFGVQYRMFYESLTDNLRPYINVGVGPTMLVTSPAQEEFFKSFGKAQTKFGFGGYVGLGANIGSTPNNLVGLNIRYFLAKTFDNGIEQYYGDVRNTFGQVYLTINIGIMY